MRKVYGTSLRKEAGLTKTIKRMAIKNAKMLNATPEIQRVAKEFRGTVGKVYEEATDVLEDFINKCEIAKRSLLAIC
jgi:phosphatidylethanolamine N-methyltransferase